MTTPIRTLAALALCAALAPAAQAHGSTKPEHGGIVQVSGETVLELVVQPDGVALYLKDDDEELASAGISAQLLVTGQGGRNEIAMQAAGGNKFEAKGVKLESGSRVGVTLIDRKTRARTAATFTVR